jgi:hypothetical protein
MKKFRTKHKRLVSRIGFAKGSVKTAMHELGYWHGIVHVGIKLADQCKKGASPAEIEAFAQEILEEARQWNDELQINSMVSSEPLTVFPDSPFPVQ